MPVFNEIHVSSLFQNLFIVLETQSIENTQSSIIFFKQPSIKSNI